MNLYRKPSISAALILGALLICITVWFRQAFITALDTHARNALDQQWGAMKGYLRIERNEALASPHANWYVDNEDQDEVSAVRRIQRFLLLTDRAGRPLQLSEAYPTITADPPAQISRRVREMLSADANHKIIWMSRHNAAGQPFLIRAGLVFGETSPREPYYLAIAAPMDRHRQFLRAFTFGLGGVVLCTLLLGWSIGRFSAKE